MKNRGFYLLFLLASLFLVGDTTLRAQSPDGLNAALDGYDYPFPVNYLPLRVEGQDLRLAYMDVPPSGKSPDSTTDGSDSVRTVVLFHGKNFPAAYWKKTITALSDAGFRVIVPDQIGFGKSSKPAIHYSFHEMATHTRQLLERLKISRVEVIGHSMGGMLGARFALMFPSMTSRLVLEDPIGLEDYRLNIVYVPISERYEQAMQQTEDQIRDYQAAYYAAWKPDFEEWVQVQNRVQHGPDAPQIAMVSALTSQMIYEQPVCYEFSKIIAPTLLVVGMKDRTAPGKDRVTPEIAAELGNFPLLGTKTAEEMPRAKLVEFDNVGHIPHLEAPDLFHREVLNFFLRKAVPGER